jgi:hypothetical protein
MFEAPTPELTLAHSTLYLADFQHDVDHDVDNWQVKNWKGLFLNRYLVNGTMLNSFWFFDK